MFWSYTRLFIISLVDEAPLTCETFIAEGGMQMFLRVLEVCSTVCHV